jgi:outer membrane biosynthesis protein TonB
MLEQMRLLNLKKLLLRVMKLKQEELIKLKSSLIPETSNQFFYCKNCDLKIDFVVAMENNFACPSCSTPMIVYSPEVVNKRVLVDMKAIKDDVKGLQNLWLKAAERVRPEVKPLLKKPVKKITKPVKKVQVKKPAKKAKKPVKPKPIKKVKVIKKIEKKVIKPQPVKIIAKSEKKKSFWDKIRGK